MYGSDLKKLFDEIDLDHKGTIELSELSHAVRRLLPDINENEVKGLMKVADLNGNGVLDCKEFFDFIGHRDSLLPSSHHQSHKAVKVNSYLYCTINHKVVCTCTCVKILHVLSHDFCDKYNISTYTLIGPQLFG